MGLATYAPQAPAPTAIKVDAEQLYLDYYERIYAYIKRRVPNAQTVEDMTADVFLKAIEACKRGRGPTSSVSGWLYRIAHNLVIDHYRARDRQPYAEDDVWEFRNFLATEAADKICERQERAELLYKGMERCNTEDQALVVIGRMQGYEFQEIGDQLGKTEGAVKALLHRAIVGVRPYLERTLN